VRARLVIHSPTIRKIVTALAILPIVATCQGSIAVPQTAFALSPYYDVRSYGAKCDGTNNDTRALQAAIDAAAWRGGGVVLLPPGRYLSGTIHLRSRVTLRLALGATLIASPQDADFDPYESPPPGSISSAKVTWAAKDIRQHPINPAFRPELLQELEELTREAVALLRSALLRRLRDVLRQRTLRLLSRTVDNPDTTYSHYSLIVGDGLSDVTIDGFGTIDGNRTRRGGPKLIALKNCRHISIRDLTLRNAPSYNISLSGTEDADLEGLTIVNGYADGIDPDNSRHVRITNCKIDTWDDAICAKASLALGHRLSTEDLSVRNCTLKTANSGFKFGTESEGDLRNVTIRECVIEHRARGHSATAGIAIESVDGGNVDGVVISKVVMRDVRTPIFLRLGNRGRGMAMRHPGAMKNISISNIVASDAQGPSSINGLPGFPIKSVILCNINVSAVGGGNHTGFDIPELPEAYPDAEMFGSLPAYALYARHIAGLTVSNWQDRWTQADLRPAAVFDDVRGLQIFGWRAAASSTPEPLVFRNVSEAHVDAVSVGR
jgi:Glycosyl hydrolases family 28/Pectate lyase superfamily protein